MQHTSLSNDNPIADTLFQHTIVPDWGMAILAWERDGKRGYQFEDGELRVFKKGYYHLLRELDRPRDEASQALDELNAKLGRRRAAKRNGSEHPAIPVRAQVDFFRAAFPKGFQGALWAKKHRGIDTKKRLKRHRNPALTSIAAEFTRGRIESAIATEHAAELVAKLAELLDETDLVSKAHVRGMARASEKAAAHMLRALDVLIWDDVAQGDELAKCFDRFHGALARAIGRKASWQLATAIPALMAPARFVCVKPTTLKRQAAWMAPNLVIEKRVSGAVYARLCGMAAELGRRLEDSNLKPRDLMDVYDFMQITLRPKAITEIRETLASKESRSPATESGDTAAA